MGSRRLSLRPTVLLFILASFVIYLSGSISRNTIDNGSSTIKLSFGNDEPKAEEQDTIEGTQGGSKELAAYPELHSPSPPSKAVSTPTAMHCPGPSVDPEDDDTEFFPSYTPNSPKHDSYWINIPSKENYLSQLTTSEKKTLDSLLPPSKADQDWDVDEIGDGYGGGTTVKWLSRKEKFDKFYSLGTEKAWRKWISDSDGNDMAPLTKFAQEYIYRHQNPPEGCEGKKFLVMSAYPSEENFGLGALVQAVSGSLSMAIRSNRILAYNITNPPGKHFFSDEGKPCGRSFDCIFLPLTSCPIPHNPPPSTDPEEPVVLEYPVHGIVSPKYYTEHPWSLPPMLIEALRRYNKNQPRQGQDGEAWEGMSFDAVRYWWRTQAASYILRVNAQAMQQLRDMRLNKFSYDKKHPSSSPTSNPAPLNIGWDCKTHNPGECTKQVMPFPLQAGGFSMHVRHGDKGIEMKLVDLPRYITSAENFIKRNPMGFRPIAFISTEDPDVLDEAKALSLTPLKPENASVAWKASPKWTWYWSDIPRLNVGPEEQLKKLGGGNRTEMTIGWMLQLMMALEADGWVGTRGSGWNRLVDQLRCVWVAGCKKPFLEVGSSGSWKYYGS